jgi:hypothetical protein
MDISVLKKLEGKVLIWSGEDQEQPIFYLIFDDLSTVAIENYTPIDDGPNLAAAIVAQNLSYAQDILKLNELLNSRKKVPDDQPIARVVEKTDPETAGS